MSLFPNLLTNHLVDKEGDGDDLVDLAEKMKKNLSLFPEHVISDKDRVVEEAKLELPRILALPRRSVVDCDRRGDGRFAPEAQALAEYVTRKYSLGVRRQCKCAEWGYPCITLLNPVQAWALREIERVDGLLGFLGVGSGKTIINILASLALRDCKVAVLLAEPSQRLHYRTHYLRLREHFRVPSLIFDNHEGTFLVKHEEVPALHFRPYSLLSQAKSTDMLEHLRPDSIIADEGHRISARNNASTRRVTRYLAEHGIENPRLVVSSGTLVKKSISNVAHLAASALGVGSPYPVDPDEVEAWAAALDPSPTPDRESSTAKGIRQAFGPRNAVERAFYVEGRITDSAVREGHRERVLQTPGVVSTKGVSWGGSLYLHEREIPKIPDVVKEALATVRGGKRPDGEWLEDALAVARTAREVASGFHYYWFFPEYAAAKSDDARAAVVAKVNEWFERRKAWTKELRAKLMHPDVHLDSPLLCTNAAERAWQETPYQGDLPVWPALSWPEWVEVKDSVVHEQRAMWLDEWFAKDAADWGREHRGIIWCLNRAFGQRVADLLGVRYHGGGANAEAEILAESGKHSIVASIKAHGSGRDGLQHKFFEQYVPEVPSGNLIWQQLLGRLAREGQREDYVKTWVPLHVGENRDALRVATREAEFVYQTTGNKQFLSLADRDFSLQGDR